MADEPAPRPIERIVVVVAVVLGTVLVATDVVEGLADRVHRLLGNRIDEVYIVFIGALAVATWLAIRRWRQARHEASARRDAQERLEVAIAELRRSNADLEHFAAVASHDLRSPLVNVRQLTAAARELTGPDLDPRAAILLDRAVANCDRMLRLVEALLTYARAGAESLAVSAVDLDGVVADALELLAADIGDTGATILVDAAHRVLGDRAALTIVIQNLLSNALRYRRPDHPPTVRVVTRRDDRRVHVRVEDNGVGVPPADRDRLFDLFGRGADVPPGQGAGIGLATCRRLAERMGGDIRFEPSSADGATFVVTLRAAPDRPHDLPSTSVHRPTDVGADVA